MNIQVDCTEHDLYLTTLMPTELADAAQAYRSTTSLSLGCSQKHTMSKYTDDGFREELKTKEYEYGFYTDIASDTFSVGLNEDIIRAISLKKEEPEWMTNWRLEAFRIWQDMIEPEWANVNYVKPDFQAISYYSAPNSKPKIGRAHV